MAPDIVAAFIGGGAGLATGVVGSLFAPWANWGVERSRLRRASRVERIKEWRRGVAYLRKAEREHGVPKRVRKNSWYQESLNVMPEFVTTVTDRDLVNVESKPWFRTLKRELPKKSRDRVRELNEQPLQGRVGQLPAFLDEAINRIERDKWNLV